MASVVEATGWKSRARAFNPFDELANGRPERLVVLVVDVARHGGSFDRVLLVVGLSPLLAGN